MRKFCYFLALALIAIGISSCDKEDWNGEELIKTDGTLILSSLELSFESSTDATVDSLIDSISSVNTSDFIVALINKHTNETIHSWLHKDIPSKIKLIEGEYTLEVKSHNATEALWDTPYYYGSKTISIQDHEESNAGNLVCKPSDVAISIEYSDDLAQLLNEESKVEVSVGDYTLEYSYYETRAGHFVLPTANSVIIAKFSATINDEAVIAHKAITEAVIGQHYIITFTVEDLNQH